eukprot:CAMPEP_0171281540 /NCGR_PEP_ID=MMETSP0790-20130122/66455_1 /TAXON_ID=2925 /ORGANISM="Alexandrium catenella, Strain OF101" /LENGTH=441 /DNA_ID=CAMNT_0011750767 /DNA_START=1 /DNA_END=1326 /DNA_ORIENTATION=+
MAEAVVSPGEGPGGDRQPEPECWWVLLMLVPIIISDYTSQIGVFGTACASAALAVAVIAAMRFADDSWRKLWLHLLLVNHSLCVWDWAWTTPSNTNLRIMTVASQCLLFWNLDTARRILHSVLNFVAAMSLAFFSQSGQGWQPDYADQTSQNGTALVEKPVSGDWTFPIYVVSVLSFAATYKTIVFNRDDTGQQEMEKDAGGPSSSRASQTSVALPGLAVFQPSPPSPMRVLSATVTLRGVVHRREREHRSGGAAGRAGGAPPPAVGRIFTGGSFLHPGTAAEASTASVFPRNGSYGHRHDREDGSSGRRRHRPVRLKPALRVEQRAGMQAKSYEEREIAWALQKSADMRAKKAREREAEQQRRLLVYVHLLSRSRGLQPSHAVQIASFIKPKPPSTKAASARASSRQSGHRRRARLLASELDAEVWDRLWLVPPIVPSIW